MVLGQWEWSLLCLQHGGLQILGSTCQKARLLGQETKSSPRLMWLTDKGQLGAMKITFPLPFQEHSEL